MTNPNSRRNFIKVIAVLFVLAALLIALQWTRNLMDSGDDVVSVDRAQSQAQPSESGLAPSRSPAVIERERAFIAEAFPAVSSWNASVLEPYLAQATKTNNWETDIGSVLTTLSMRLGALDRYSEPELIDIADAPVDDQGNELAVYEFTAFYETGVADINLVLADNDGESVLYSFNINVHDESR